MEARGHQVRVISSGPTPTSCYQFKWQRHFPGLEYVVSGGRTDYLSTFRKWIRELPRIMRGLWELRGIVREFQPDLVISDFDPLTASPLIEPRCEVVAVSRQVTLLDPMVPLPPEKGFDRKMTRSVIRLFTCGADRKLGYHYTPASHRCLPPIIRPEARQAKLETGDYVLLYCGLKAIQPSPEDLDRWAKRTGKRVIAYGFHEALSNSSPGLVEFRRPDRLRFLNDVASAGAVITTAGLTTPIEAFLFRKPLVVVPIPRQWEQLVNAYHLELSGIARSSTTWDLDLLLESPSPAPDHPLIEWMSISSDRVLDLIFDEDPTPQNQLQIKAA